MHGLDRRSCPSGKIQWRDRFPRQPRAAEAERLPQRPFVGHAPRPQRLVLAMGGETFAKRRTHHPHGDNGRPGGHGGRWRAATGGIPVPMGRLETKCIVKAPQHFSCSQCQGQDPCPVLDHANKAIDPRSQSINSLSCLRNSHDIGTGLSASEATLGHTRN
jgi:hypothetical protein